MVVVMDMNSTVEQIEIVNARLDQLGFQTQLIRGVKRIVIGAVGDRLVNDLRELQQMPGVEKIVPIMKPYKLVSREAKSENTIIDIRGIKIGGNSITVIAGPCAVESRDQLLTAPPVRLRKREDISSEGELSSPVPPPIASRV